MFRLAFGLLLLVCDLIHDAALRRNEDDAKETPVPEKSATRHTPSSLERDTLPAVDPQLLRDQLDALSSPEV